MTPEQIAELRLLLVELPEATLRRELLALAKEWEREAAAATKLASPLEANAYTLPPTCAPPWAERGSDGRA